MDILHKVLVFLTSFSMIICSCLWMICSYISMKCMKSIGERMTLLEALVLDMTHRQLKTELSILTENHKEQQHDESN